MQDGEKDARERETQVEERDGRDREEETDERKRDREAKIDRKELGKKKAEKEICGERLSDLNL